MIVYFWHIYCTVVIHVRMISLCLPKSVMTLLFFSTGIGLTLNGVQYTNNSVVNITDIGTDGAALLCTSTFSVCCFSGSGHEWYFPNGSTIQRTDTTYYRTRTFSRTGGTVRLNRNLEATTTGVFHCDIPDASGDIQSLYVGIYTATTGESCTFCMTYLLTEYRGGCEGLLNRTVYMLHHLFKVQIEKFLLFVN